MTPTRILIGQFLLSLFLISGFTWLATQWTAEALGHQRALGSIWFHWDDTPIYKPWRFFQWWYAYDAYAPVIFWKGAFIVICGGLMAFLSAVAGSVLRARQVKNVTTYGSARWGTPKDARKAGLNAPKGVILGTFDQHYLRHDGPEHIMAFAPTRSGKGVGLVVPTLLSWGASAIIHDIKGENWSLTSHWRSSFSTCQRFDPTSMTSARFNPLLEVRKGDNEVRDAQNIAEMIIDPDGLLDRKLHWDRTAYKLIVAAILHVLYTDEEKTLARVASLLTEPGRSVEEILNQMMETNHIGTEDEPRVHPEIAKGAKELEIKPEKEQASVISTMLGYFAIYSDPIVQRATSISDFNIEDLIHGERPLSIYLTVPPSDLIRTRPLMRLILNQIVSRLTQEHPSPDSKRHRVLLMLDEFPALGRLESFETSLSFMASYGLKAFLVAQSLNQVEKAYGANNSILDNCHVRVAFATNDERTAKRISDMLGTKTEQRHQRNYAGHRLSVWLGHVMVSQQETSRALLTPGEVMQLPPDQAIVQSASAPPLLANKLRYFLDKNFRHRTGEAVQEGLDLDRGIMTSCWSGMLSSPHPSLAHDQAESRRHSQRRTRYADTGMSETDGDESSAPKACEPSDGSAQSAELLRQARLMVLADHERE